MKKHKDCTCIANDVAGDEICKHCEIIWDKSNDQRYDQSNSQSNIQRHKCDGNEGMQKNSASKENDDATNNENYTGSYNIIQKQWRDNGDAD